MSLLLIAGLAMGQTCEQQLIEQIYQDALTNPIAYRNLQELCTKAPGRLLGSPASRVAMQVLEKQLKAVRPDTIYYQHYRTPSWQCIKPAQAVLSYGGKKQWLKAVNLGLSCSTPKGGISARLVEVHSMKQLDSLGRAGLEGKIVFFNRPMDNTRLTTFDAYGGAIDQRSSGASRASALGAVGVVIRSLATEHDDYPHTGVSHYKEGVKEIPNLALSTNDADLLSRVLAQDANATLRLTSTTQKLDTLETANLIAEIKGSTYPEKIILIGAHMDAWFNTPGAHDDGAGCAQMIDVFRIFRQLNIRPQHTIRLVLFMDEEMLQSGSKAYAEMVGREKRQHLACIESDAGGLLPLGFEADASEEAFGQLRKLTLPLAGFGVYQTVKGYGGVDISPLKRYGFPLIGLLTNSQRYFEYHHSSHDTPDQVSRREMQTGTASIASLVYLIDKNGGL